jgi:hypothetical protein
MTYKDVHEVATTGDTNDPVFRVEVGDGHAHVICNDGTLYVPSVMCSGETRLSEVMDHAVRTFGLTHIKFTSVISDRLRDVLDGFEETREYHEGMGCDVPVLEGEWDTDSRTNAEDE